MRRQPCTALAPDTACLRGIFEGRKKLCAGLRTDLRVGFARRLDLGAFASPEAVAFVGYGILGDVCPAKSTLGLLPLL